MLDMTWVRDNLETLAGALRNRGVTIDLDEFRKKEVSEV